MPTLRSAAALLAAVRATDGRGPHAPLAPLAPIAALAGCGGSPDPLDSSARERLGVPPEFGAARIAAGPDTLRALLLASDGTVPLRQSLARLGSRMASRAPQMLWLAIARSATTGEVAVAAWDTGRTPPRVRALVVDTGRVLDSDAETLCALAAARSEVDVLTHARWLEVLGRDALTRRFYRTLERVVGVMAEGAEGRAPAEARESLALLQVSRLLFLSFLEAKGWLDGDRAFLARRFDACMAARGGYQRQVLLPLFFGTLNTPPARRARVARELGRIPFLNGGLFARTPLERRHAALAFRDEDFGTLFGELLGRYRFTAREDSTTWSEAAVDPEMLGRAFESLMARRDRRASGTFYTPQRLVESVTSEALADSLAGDGVPREMVASALSGEAPELRARDALRRRLGDFAVLDPACGSGAFLVHALERLAALAATLGDARPVAEVRRAVLAGSIFGVDVNPTAVWLCELRLWLSVVIESDADDPAHVAPLPNLDRHVRVGEALLGQLPTLGDQPRSAEPAGVGRRGPVTIGRLRRAYSRAVGVRKKSLARALDREERTRALGLLDAEMARVAAERHDLLAALRGRDLFGDRARAGRAQREALERMRRLARELRAARRALAAGGALPFSFASHFADVLSRGGFDLILGNPPWVRLHRIPVAERARLREAFSVYRHAAWRGGAERAGAAPGFASQVDLSALFVERALSLARAGGTVVLLVPAKLWRSLAGGGLRWLVTRRHTLLAIDDWSDDASTFDAAVYPSAVRIVAGEGDDTAPCVRMTVHARQGALAWTVVRDRVSLDDDPASPWLLVPPEVRRAFELLSGAGTPMAASVIGAPRLGVKCGANEAFCVTELDAGAHAARVRAGAREGEIERAALHPVLRGAEVGTWRQPPGRARIVWTHDDDGHARRHLPPLAGRWLAPARRALEARADARHGARWWTLFRVDAAAHDLPRVVWPDVARAPRAVLLRAGDPTVPLNSCYLARCPTHEDAMALAAVLNSPLAGAWLHVIAEPARGGYHRYLGWTLALLPLPRDWVRARARLAPVAARALAGDVPAPNALLDVVLGAYRLRLDAIAPLLAWAAR